jgi:hypothetical protein
MVTLVYARTVTAELIDLKNYLYTWLFNSSVSIMIDETQPNSETEATKDLLGKKIGEIEPLSTHSHLIITKKEDLKEVVEGPLLSACEELYDKNIETYMTSANRKNVSASLKPEQRNADIQIYFDSLSEDNKKVGQTLGQVSQIRPDARPILTVLIPVTLDSTYGEIQSRAEAIVHKFNKQKLRTLALTLKEMRQYFRFDPEDESHGVDSFSGQYYWDPELELFFLSKEMRDKALEEVEEDNK